MELVHEEELYQQKLEHFVHSLTNTFWMINADENTIDIAFNCAVDVQENFYQDNRRRFCEIAVQKYPDFDFKKSLDLLLEHLVKSQNLSESLTLYAVKKYVIICSKNDLCRVLESMCAEARLREYLVKFMDECSETVIDEPTTSDTKLPDWHQINAFLDKVKNGNAEPQVILNSLKTQTLLYLNAVKCGSLSGKALLDSMISCLESQPDLRLWFLILKNENQNIVLELCEKYNNFLQSVLKFFDKFSQEVESNYDEDLNMKYSHLNLDFDDFVQLFKLFLNKKGTRKVVDDYLERKIMCMEENFSFWIDVQACL